MLLWLTVLFANFAEAVAEAAGGHRRPRYASARKDVMATLVASPGERLGRRVPASTLKEATLWWYDAGRSSRRTVK